MRKGDRYPCSGSRASEPLYNTAVFLSTSVHTAKFISDVENVWVPLDTLNAFSFRGFAT